MEEQMPQNKPSNPSAPLFIILGVVVLAIAALFMYFGDYGSDTNSNLNSNTNTVVNSNTVANTNIVVNTNAVSNQNINTNSNTNSSTNTNGSVDTSNWEIYNSNERGYSFMYPTTYRIEEGDIYINIFSDATDDSSAIRVDELKVVVSKYENINVGIEEWIPSFNIEDPIVSSFAINNSLGQEVVGRVEQMGARFDVNYILYLVDGTGMVFSVIPTDTQLIDIFHEIVRSFRFIQ